MERRTFVNLIAVGLAAAALLVYAGTQLLAQAVLDPSYPLHAELPRAGGLVAEKEVTYNGDGVGQVADLELDGETVMVEMAIDEGVRIPRDVDVVVQRSSAIGEQALDIRPREPLSGATAFSERGDTLEVGEVTLPPEIQELLELANDVFEPIDDDNAGLVVAELADAVRGRQSELRSILADSADFSEAVADNGDDFDRFFAASRTVNRALADNRETLGALFGDIADATTILTDMRSEFEGVLADAPPTLALTGDLVERSQPNISCLIDDFADFNAFTARPENLDNAAEALRMNRFFFDGFDTITQTDPFGGEWQRIQLAMEEEPGERYEPQRPIRDVLPGGACSSPFGEGAPAATQADFSPTTTETEVVPPEDNRAEPVRRGPRPRTQELAAGSGQPATVDGSGTADGSGAADEDGEAVAVSTQLPAPGDSGVSLLLGIGVLLGARRLTGSLSTTRSAPASDPMTRRPPRG